MSTLLWLLQDVLRDLVAEWKRDRKDRQYREYKYHEYQGRLLAGRYGPVS